LSIYQALAELDERNEAGALCTIVRSRGSTPRRTGSKMLIYPDGKIMGSVGGGELENRVINEARQAIIDGRARYLEYDMTDPSRGDPGVRGGHMEVFVEPIQPDPTGVVIGVGHIGKKVAHLAHWLGFRVVVSDDRPEFCTSDAVPEADEFQLVGMAELPSQLEITPWTY
jgi:xanthine dehydrogenase accessory factor